MKTYICQTNDFFLNYSAIDFVKKHKNIFDSKTIVRKYFSNSLLTVVKEISYFEKEKYFFVWMFFNNFDKYLYIMLDNKKEFKEIDKIIKDIIEIKYDNLSEYIEKLNNYINNFKNHDFENIKYIRITNKSDELICEIENINNKFYLSRFKNSFLDYYDDIIDLEDIYYIIDKCKKYYNVNLIFKNL